jgi:hypothetical protein
VPLIARRGGGRGHGHRLAGGDHGLRPRPDLHADQARRRRPRPEPGAPARAGRHHDQRRGPGSPTRRSSAESCATRSRPTHL